jgi:hypothetical protein
MVFTWLRRGASGPAAGQRPGTVAAVAALILGLGVCGAVAAAPPALASGCTVKDGTHTYTDLQAAVSAAHRGDTLTVAGTCASVPRGDGSAVTIRVSLTIDGARGATVKPKPSGAGRVFEIATGATVTLHGLTIIGGGGDISRGGGILNSGNLTVSDATVTGNTQTVDGAGIYNGRGATLTLTGSTVSDDDTSGGNGGGIYNNQGRLTITGSTVQGDKAGNGTSTGTGDGGGIYNYAGRLAITGSTVEQNAATVDGGGLYNASASLSDGGLVTLTGGTFVNDSAVYGNGGGIYNDGDVTLAGTTVTQNGADSGSGHGGGVYNAPDWNLIAANSTVSGNTAEFGGGVYNDGTSGNPGFASLSKSTVSGNEAEQAGGGLGNEGDMELTNSTVSNNSDVGHGGGIFDDAGTTLSLANVTVSDNTAFDGGGLYNDGALTTAGTIIAKDSASSAGPDCDELPAGTVTDRGYNLIGTTSGCFTTIRTDITNTAVVLGPLRSNGGPTQTLLPLAGSPAINAIPAAICESAEFLGSRHPTDQRGVSRPQGGACEIGSVEVAAPVITKFSPASGKPGTKVTLTGKHFKGTDGVTAVYFAGFSADFTIVSATTIIATVPSRARTGRVAVTAAGGSFTTTATFKVT